MVLVRKSRRFFPCGRGSLCRPQNFWPRNYGSCELFVERVAPLPACHRNAAGGLQRRVARRGRPEPIGALAARTKALGGIDSNLGTVGERSSRCDVLSNDA